MAIQDEWEGKSKTMANTVRTMRFSETQNEIFDETKDLLGLTPSKFLQQCIPWEHLAELVVIKGALPDQVPGPRQMIETALDHLIRNYLTDPRFTQTPVVSQCIAAKTFKELCELWQSYEKARLEQDGYHLQEVRPHLACKGN